MEIQNSTKRYAKCLLIDCIKNFGDSPLDDLVFETENSEWALLSVAFWDVFPTDGSGMVRTGSETGV